MDRNDLLIATRSVFLAQFNQRVPMVLAHSIGQLFNQADRASSMLEQRRLLAARQLIMSHDQLLEQQLSRQVEQLLHRSFQTAYSHFRPSFTEGLNATLSLVESASFEEELHIDQITLRFRQEAEEAIRDLNIRIALLLEQDVIKERENPFRTYIISRSFASALEETVAETGSDNELIPVLLAQLTTSMCPHVAPLYAALNQLLAQHGIAAQLQLKVRKQSEPAAIAAGNSLDLPDASPSAFTPEAQHSAPASGGREPQRVAAPSRSSAASSATSPAASSAGSVGAAPWSARSEDQFLDFVQSRPSASQALSPGAAPASAPNEMAGMGYGGYGGSDSMDLAAAPASSAEARASIVRAPSWLSHIGQVGRSIQQFFSGHSLQQGAQGQSPVWDDAASLELRSVSAPLSQSLQSLIAVATPTADAMWRGDGQLRNLILEQRQQLGASTSDVNEAMTIDVVAMLFEFILRDDKVPAEVRAQLGRLQFLVLKIALQDPNLFARKTHPARMLVNRIGSISLGMQQNSESASRVNTEICRIVAIILADESEDLALFVHMLDALDAWVANELAHCEKMASSATQVLDSAKQRTLHFARITAMISDALSPYTIEPYLYDFLVSTWARVIELAGREAPHKAIQYRLLVPDLIWSLAPKVDRDECKILLGLIPTMITTLREGVLTLNWTAEQLQELNLHLVDAHRLAMRSGASQVLSAVPPPLSVMHEAFAPFLDAVHTTEATENEVVLALNPLFIQAEIDALEINLNLIDQLIESELGPPTAVDIDSEDEDFTACLSNGVAVEINFDGSARIAQLSWQANHPDAIVLTWPDQDAPAVLSLRAFRRLFARDRVRFLEQAPLFDRAMNELLASAEQVASAETALPSMAMA
ncbi:DUF1631 family protein [uncultured Deefgea sp.]|uniref:DUF1631 family protein n=1 Tax=uncultured Deefgea sp. TaxID=1304914 RepID=UPI0026097D48|nr:DUF1631 family protein [uncultured Deefgea sp.]